MTSTTLVTTLGVLAEPVVDVVGGLSEAVMPLKNLSNSVQLTAVMAGKPAGKAESAHISLLVKVARL